MRRTTSGVLSVSGDTPTTSSADVSAIRVVTRQSKMRLVRATKLVTLMVAWWVLVRTGRTSCTLVGASRLMIGSSALVMKACAVNRLVRGFEPTHDFLLKVYSLYLLIYLVSSRYTWSALYATMDTERVVDIVGYTVYTAVCRHRR